MKRGTTSFHHSALRLVAAHEQSLNTIPAQQRYVNILSISTTFCPRLNPCLLPLANHFWDKLLGICIGLFCNLKHCKPFPKCVLFSCRVDHLHTQANFLRCAPHSNFSSKAFPSTTHGTPTKHASGLGIGFPVWVVAAVSRSRKQSHRAKNPLVT